MTLEGAINFNETPEYIIYTMNSVTTGQYCFVLKKNVSGSLNMLVDLHMKKSFDEVSSGAKTKEQLITEISTEYDKVKTKYVDCMLVMPMFDDATFQNAVANVDKQKMFDEVKKIGAITSELYKKLTDAGVEKQKIDQKIVIVEKNEDDKKFVSWLKEQMPNFVDGLSYNELNSEQQVTNPFADSGSIFGPVVPEVKEDTSVSNSVVSGGSIFDNPAPVSESSIPSVDPIIPVAPVVAEATPDITTNNNTDIFGSSVEKNESQNEVQNVVSNNLFGPVNNVEEVKTENVSNSNPAPVVEVPKPVESSPLEGTTTFSAISNAAASENISAESDGEVGKSVEHASKGFANLLILLVILAGVTFASIELGKFLYSVYGA